MILIGDDTTRLVPIGTLRWDEVNGEEGFLQFLLLVRSGGFGGNSNPLTLVIGVAGVTVITAGVEGSFWKSLRDLEVGREPRFFVGLLKVI